MLHYLLKQPKVKTENPPVFILMHGIGGNENMLSFLASQLPDDFLIFLLRAPNLLSDDKYSWFKVEFMEGNINIDIEDVYKSMDEVLRFIEYIKEKYEFDHSRMFLGGFSQGGEIAYNVGLTHPDLLKGIVVFSSRIPEEIHPMIKQSESLLRLKIFVYHGSNDPIVNVDFARNSIAYLQKLGLNPVYRETEDKHRINLNIFKELNLWLNE